MSKDRDMPDSQKQNVDEAKLEEAKLEEFILEEVKLEDADHFIPGDKVKIDAPPLNLKRVPLDELTNEFIQRRTEVIENYLEIYFAKAQRNKKRPFMDELKDLNKGGGIKANVKPLTDEEKATALTMQAIIDEMKSNIKSFENRRNFKNFPPFPDDENKRNEMIEEIANIFKQGVAGIDEILTDDFLLNQNIPPQDNNKMRDIIKNDLIFSLIHHLLPMKPPNIKTIQAVHQTLFLLRDKKCYEADDPAAAFHQASVEAIEKGLKVASQFDMVFPVAYHNKLKQEAVPSNESAVTKSTSTLNEEAVIPSSNTPTASSTPNQVTQDKILNTAKEKESRGFLKRSFAFFSGNSYPTPMNSPLEQNTIKDLSVNEMVTLITSLANSKNSFTLTREKIFESIYTNQNNLNTLIQALETLQKDDPKQFNKVFSSYKLDHTFWVRVAKSDTNAQLLRSKLNTPMMQAAKLSRNEVAKIQGESLTMKQSVKNEMKDVKDKAKAAIDSAADVFTPRRPGK